MTASLNPYEPPQSVPSATPASATSTPVDWKRILKRWEILRPVYNIAVGAVGLLGLVVFSLEMSLGAVSGIAFYGVCANIMYLLGPVIELYLNWFVDTWKGRLVPHPITRFIRSPYLTGLLFSTGTLFSIGLTFAVVLGRAINTGLGD